MYELSLNIMDIAQNSIRAEASLVEISVSVDEGRDVMGISIADDGKGMAEAQVRAATDPFFTTRTTRKVGLGLPYFEMSARMCGGDFGIRSKPGEGTTVTATFRISNIDRAPLGDMGQTMALLAGANPGVDFVYRLSRGGGAFAFDTREIKEALDGVGIGTPEVIVYMEGYINENSEDLLGGLEL
ncbi:MAG: HAMP domain-containing histidine kinase [Clostridiales bacterium]|jgi:anti-sigma regulatory factor (Ser/Thr protein kinase)|nr:HAMP domain-containing histidine kinase [Clostridiales bacterium]